MHARRIVVLGTVGALLAIAPSALAFLATSTVKGRSIDHVTIVYSVTDASLTFEMASMSLTVEQVVT